MIDLKKIALEIFEYIDNDKVEECKLKVNNLTEEEKIIVLQEFRNLNKDWYKKEVQKIRNSRKIGEEKIIEEHYKILSIDEMIKLLK